jgi:predicted ATPase
MIARGWVLTERGQVEEGIAQMQQSLVSFQTMGTEMQRPQFLTLLAEAYEKRGQAKEGLTVLAEALSLVDKTGECFYEAEVYRLKGELLLAQARERTTGAGQGERVTDS